MQRLRIAVAFVALLAAWIVFLPREPTLLTPAPFVEEAEISPEAASPVGAETSPDTAVTVERAPAVRAIVPSPLAGGGDLRRLPPAQSGAATPITSETKAPSPADAAGEPPPAPQTGETVAGAAPETAAPAQPEYRRFSQPIAIDSGTIQVGRTTLRIAGVEPIEPEARCISGDRSLPCGVRARTAVRGWLRGRSLLCPVPPEAGDDLTVPCLLGEEDVGEWLVVNGWAAAAPDSRYVEAEATAKQARRGIWEYDIEP